MTAQDGIDRIAARKASQGANLFGRLQATANASRAQAQRLLQDEADLSITEWRILWDLSEAGPLSVQDMAAIQRTDHSLISRALSGMRAKGYVRSDAGTADKRRSVIALTEEGARAFRLAAPIMARRRAKLRETFSEPELAQFIDLIDRFDAFLAEPLDTFRPDKDTL